MNDLGLPTIADGQADGQWQTSNDADAGIADALSDVLLVDFSAGNVTLTATQYRSAIVFKPSGVLAAARTLTLPAVKRPLTFHNTDATYTVTLKSTDGASPETALTKAVAPGEIFVGYTNGSSPGLYGATVSTTGAGVSDGDKGDLTVSSSGSVWTIDNDVVTNAKSANMAQSTIKGRAAGAGTGDPTDLSAAQVVAIIGDTDGTFAANSDSVVATQKATKTYVDGLAINLGKRGRVRAATTANITILTALNNGDTLDGLTLATGEWVLVKDQSSASENGIYSVGVVPARVSDFDEYDEYPGSLIAVEEGTANADTIWLCTSNAGGTINVTAINFSQFVVSGGFTAASTTEVLTGTDSSKGVTPDALAALWEKGADVASAGTTSLGEGGYFHITGTTTITDIDWATAKDGRIAWVIFDGILTLTHNATTLKLPGGANITTAAGDRACFVQDASDNVICLAYVRADGKPLVASVSGTPFEMEVACSDEVTALTAGTAKTTFRMPRGVTLSSVRAMLVTAQASGSIFTVDINEAGSTILSTKLTIDNTELTSTTAATAAVISDDSLADDALMTVDIDQIGDGTAKGLKIVLIGTRS